MFGFSGTRTSLISVYPPPCCLRDSQSPPTFLPSMYTAHLRLGCYFSVRSFSDGSYTRYSPALYPYEHMYSSRSSCFSTFNIPSSFPLVSVVFFLPLMSRRGISFFRGGSSISLSNGHWIWSVIVSFLNTCWHRPEIGDNTSLSLSNSLLDGAALVKQLPMLCTCSISSTKSSIFHPSSDTHHENASPTTSHVHHPYVSTYIEHRTLSLLKLLRIIYYHTSCVDINALTRIASAHHHYTLDGTKGRWNIAGGWGACAMAKRSVPDNTLTRNIGYKTSDKNRSPSRHRREDK